MKQLYDYCTNKRKCEKLYSDIINFNVHNVTIDEKWNILASEVKKVNDEVKGIYQSIKIYDDIFSVGEVVEIGYMQVVEARIMSIEVDMSVLNHIPNYEIVLQDKEGLMRRVIDHVRLHKLERVEVL